MMRVLFLSRYQFPIVKSGGTGVVVYELMQEITRTGIALEHWTWRSEEQTKGQKIKNMLGFAPLMEVRISNIKLEKLLNVTLTNLNMIKEFERLKEFDIVHVHTWELFLVGIIAKYIWNIPLFFTTHDIMEGDLPREVHSTDIYEYGVLGERILATETDAIIPVSEENKILFEAIYPEVKGKSHVIPNGVNLEIFKKLPSRTVFDKHNIPLKEPYVFFIGRASKQKGIHHLVNAIKYLPNSIPIIFATSTKRWDGEEYDTTKYFINLIHAIQENRRNVYLVLNEWNRKLLSELYSHAAFTVMPSIYEPCGMVALESQACSTPVIANKVGFIKESVIHNQTGLLLELIEDKEKYAKKLAESIVKLFNNKTLCRYMSENTRKNVEKNHSWKNRAQQHVKLYEKLINNSVRAKA